MYYLDMNLIFNLQFFLNIDNQYIKNIDTLKINYSLSKAIKFFSVLNYIILQNYRILYIEIIKRIL